MILRVIQLCVTKNLFDGSKKRLMLSGLLVGATVIAIGAVFRERWVVFLGVLALIAGFMPLWYPYVPKRKIGEKE